MSLGSGYPLCSLKTLWLSLQNCTSNRLQTGSLWGCDSDSEVEMVTRYFSGSNKLICYSAFPNRLIVLKIMFEMLSSGSEPLLNVVSWEVFPRPVS